jgi:hypothetical protein
MSQVYGGPNPQTDDFLFNIPTRIGDDGKAYGSSGALGRANMDYFWRNSKNATPSFGENFKPLGLEGLNQTAFNSALTTPMQTMVASPASSGFNLGNFAQGLLGAGVDYYAGQQDIDAAAQFGQQASQAAQQLGQQAVEGTTFKPFSVTTGAGTTTTTPTGGFDLGLSPEQAALQAQLTQQAGGLFGGVTGDIGQASQDIYSQIRGLQAPEEQREQLRLNEELFARGRGGISSAQFGGQGAEQFGYNKAQQEAMNQAAFLARQQALGEQEQQLALGTGLLGQAYVPQREQLDALTAGTNIANIAGTGQRQGAQLQSQLGQTGLEALLRSYESGLAGEQTQRNQLVDLLLGSGQGANAVEGLLGGSSLGGTLGSAVGVGDAPTPQWIKDLGNDAKKWLGI